MKTPHLLTRSRPTRSRRLASLAFALAIAALTSSGLATAAGPPRPMAPTVSVPYTTSLTYSSVMLNNYFNAHGQPTNYYFQYGTTSGYGAQTPLAPGGNATTGIRVSQQVGGLQPATLYHFRFVAISAAGATTSVDRKFITPKVPLSLQIAGVPNPVTFGNPFVVEGTLSGTGSANHAIVLQANLFPYTTGFKTVGNPELTNATGGFSFPVVGLGENAQMRVVTVGKPEVVSPVMLENVAVSVTFHARRTHRRGRWRLYGTVTPAEPGALVGFQLLVAGGRTVNTGGTVVKAGTPTVSHFSRRVRLRHHGVYRALIQVNDGAHVAAYSAPVLIR
jgi:hypothetical protein